MTYVVEEVPEVSENYLFGIEYPTTKWTLKCFEDKGITFVPLREDSAQYTTSCRIGLLSFPQHLSQIRSLIETHHPQTLYILTDNSALGKRALASIRYSTTRIQVCYIDRETIPKDGNSAVDLISNKSGSISYISSKRPNIAQDSSGGVVRQPRSRLKLLLLLFGIFAATLFTFLIPFTIGTLYIYRSAHAILAKDIPKAESSLQSAKPFVELSSSLYGASRPVLSFFFLAFVFDPILDGQDLSYKLINTVLSTWDDTQRILDLAKKDAPSAQMDAVASGIAEKIRAMSAYTQELSQIIPESIPALQAPQKLLDETSAYLKKIQPFADQLHSLIGGDAPHTYLVYFYNNMEIRPGGGFIGSFAFVTFQKYKLISFIVHDVYDADGQLKAHIDPPLAIRDHLQQPHWFLRDSNSNPDFEENISQGLFFLEKEFPTLPKFDGVIGITTTGVGTLLDAFDTIYLADFDQTITSANFYLVTQLESEKDFFPGSIQKKSFLSSLTHTILDTISSASIPKLSAGLKTALDQRQIMLYFTDPLAQKAVTDAGWHGKVVDTPCLARSQNCLNDYILSTDMNVGLNKANYYVSRFMDISPTIQDDSSVQTSLSLTYRNDSPTELYPAGTYKTYTQIYIPSHATHIEVHDQSGNNLLYDSTNTLGRRVIGTYLEVAPLSTNTIRVQYSLRAPNKPGNLSYQLVIQKQLGSINNDIALHITYPSSIDLLSKNFQALAKAQSVNYNTNLLADRVFVTEFRLRK